MQILTCYLIILFSCVNFTYGSDLETIMSEDQTGIDQYINILRTTIGSTGPVTIGTFKVQPNGSNHPKIVEAFDFLCKKGKKVDVLLESRLTKEEYRKSQFLSVDQSPKNIYETDVTLFENIKQFDNIHVKIMIADDFALIGTTNYDDTNYSDENSKIKKRDFSILTKNISIIHELQSIISKVKQGRDVEWPQYSVYDIKNNESRLSWGPNQHLKHFLDLIKSATQQICIYQQDLQDLIIVDTLKEKLKEGIKVLILMSHNPFTKQHPNNSMTNLKELAQSNAHVCLTGELTTKSGFLLHIHAKVLIIDGGIESQIIYVGSANFYPKVLDTQASNLNVGLITRNKSCVDFIHNKFMEDWDEHKSQMLHP